VQINVLNMGVSKTILKSEKKLYFKCENKSSLKPSDVSKQESAI